jgi:hypothetical protein
MVNMGTTKPDAVSVIYVVLGSSEKSFFQKLCWDNSIHQLLGLREKQFSIA